MKISIIGAGEMGGAFAHGLLKSNLFKPDDITMANRHDDKLKPFALLGASVTTDNKAAAQLADIVAIVVKPNVVQTVVEEIKPVMDYKKQIVVNMAASISLSQLESWFNKDGDIPRICQTLPNIGISQKQSMTFIVPNSKMGNDLHTVTDIFDDLGQTLVTTEPLLVAGNALAGCGIAYVMRYVRAASEAGVEMGLKADQAKDIVLQTMKGAVALLQGNNTHPEAEIDKVTTPGGLTIKGLNTMERYGFTTAVIEGIKAGRK
jgi:pyrroline-5-carboxylate reductase